MGTRPQTLYGIADSPVGLAAWILDHDTRSYELIARVFDGQSEGLTRDDVLDNITLYWLTNTGYLVGPLYWENKLPFFAPKHFAIPAAVSVFPDEIYQASRSWAESGYPKLILLPPPPQGRALCGVGAAAGDCGRSSRRFPVSALRARNPGGRSTDAARHTREISHPLSTLADIRIKPRALKRLRFPDAKF